MLEAVDVKSTRMNEKTLLSLEKLVLALDADPRIKSLNELEPLVSLDQGIKTLHEEAIKAQESYYEAKEKGLEKKIVEERLQAFHKAKLALDENPLASIYTKIYSEVNDLYLHLDDILFSSFRALPCQKGEKC